MKNDLENAMEIIKDLIKQRDELQAQVDRLISGDEIESDRLTSTDNKLLEVIAERDQLQAELKVANKFHDVAINERDLERLVVNQLQEEQSELVKALLYATRGHLRKGRVSHLADEECICIACTVLDKLHVNRNGES